METSIKPSWRHAFRTPKKIRRRQRRSLKETDDHFLSMVQNKEGDKEGCMDPYAINYCENCTTPCPQTTIGDCCE